jgi:hypothetical protein
LGIILGSSAEELGTTVQAVLSRQPFFISSQSYSGGQHGE